MRVVGEPAGQRVVDEPLYAFYLDRTRLDHPGRDEIIAAGDTDWRRVVASLTGDRPATGVHYQKHMTHHLLPELPRDWIADAAQRAADPRPGRGGRVLHPRPGERRRERHRARAAEPSSTTSSTSVPVIDSADFLQDPEGYLRWLCDYVGVAVHRRDAALAGRAARLRRRVGEVLVRRGVGLHRLRAVPAARGVTSTAPRSPRPRRAARTTSGCARSASRFE